MLNTVQFASPSSAGWRLICALLALFLLSACGGDDEAADAKAKQKAELQAKIAARKAASEEKKNKKAV